MLAAWEARKTLQDAVYSPASNDVTVENIR